MVSICSTFEKRTLLSDKTDMVMQDKTPETPYVYEKMVDFVDKVEDHNKIRFVLDLALPQFLLPHFMMYVDH